MKKIELINCIDYLVKGNYESFFKSRGMNFYKYGFIII